jgi:outer membrane protein TolC
MQKLRLSIYFYLILMLFAGLVTGADKAPLTLDAAIQIALQENHYLKSRGLEVKTAAAGQKASRGDLLPQLDAYAGYLRTSNPMLVIPMKEFGGEPPPVFTRNHYQAGLSFSLPLYEGGRRWHKVTASDLSKLIAEQQLSFSRQEIIANVTNTFNQVLSFKALENAQLKALNSLKKAQADTQKRLDLGRAAPVEMMKMETQVARQEQDLIHTRQAALRARQGLAVLLGKNPALLNEPEGQLTTTIPELPADDKATLETTIAQRPDIRKTQEEVKLAATEIKLQSGYHLPDIALIGDYGQRTGSGLNDNEEVWSAGINVKFNLYAGGQIKAKVTQAEARLEAAQERLAQQKLTAMAEIVQAESNIEEAGQRIKMADKTIASARETYRIEELKYNTGASTITDSLLAQAAWFEATALKAEAVYELEKAIVDYKLACGSIEEGKNND